LGDRPDHTGSIVIEDIENVTATITVTGDVAVSGTVEVSNAVLNVEGTVAISGPVTVSGDVTITSGVVNIETAAGTTINIGKVDYTPISRTVSNDNGFTGTDKYALQYYGGKYFPGGMRGYINQVTARIFNETADYQDIVVKLSARPGSATISTYALMIPPNQDAPIDLAIQEYWDFDSLFVWFHNVDGHLKIYYDTPTAQTTEDFFLSTDEETWSYQTRRLHVRVAVYTQVPYPVPVEGTITIKDIDQATLGAWAATPIVYNVTMIDADTEYSQALPTTCRKFEIQTRDGTAFRVAYETGKVAAPTEPYVTIPENCLYYHEMISPTALTLYFACAEALKVVEIIEWS
jgi:hypothetical protein